MLDHHVLDEVDRVPGGVWALVALALALERAEAGTEVDGDDVTNSAVNMLERLPAQDADSLVEALLKCCAVEYNEKVYPYNDIVLRVQLRRAA